MPAKKRDEDWVRVEKQMATPTGVNQRLLALGTRQSHDNIPDEPNHPNRWARTLFLMEQNRKRRKGPLRERLKGLFGGGE